jgi:hypothetical protein
MRLRGVDDELSLALESEEVHAETGIALDRHTRTPQGRVDACVLGVEGLHALGAAGGRRRDAGALSVLIAMDPITSCLGRTGAFGAGSYLFRAAQPWGEQRFVIKPVLTKQASVRFTLTEGAPARWVASRGTTLSLTRHAQLQPGL